MESNNKGYKLLLVYQRANELALTIYKITILFPKEELYGLTSQIRRTALSVVANIVEGYGKHTKKERAQFAYNARGSLTETEFYIDFSYELGYINLDKYRACRRMTFLLTLQVSSVKNRKFSEPVNFGFRFI